MDIESQSKFLAMPASGGTSQNAKSTTGQTFRFFTKKTLFWFISFASGILLIIIVLIFVVLPVIFMRFVSLQRMLIFTHFGLPEDKEQFEDYPLPGLKNRYVGVKDVDGTTEVKLGVWQLLPVDETYEAFHDKNFDYDKALAESSKPILLYFHGTGESRASSARKYEVFRYYFQVITFDYRGYADSDKATLSEAAVGNDSMQLYHWLSSQTNSDIYVWGHSLGAAIAAKTLSDLRTIRPPKGLVLESAFTSLKDELYVHPYGKYFSWLPWFEATVVRPLQRNGFQFNTARNLDKINCSIMILHAEDDDIVPVEFGRELFKIARDNSQKKKNFVTYHEFDSKFDHDHNFIYSDAYLQYYIRDFLRKVI